MSLAADTMTLRVRGLPLTMAPHHVDDDGFAVFYINSAKVDPFSLCDRARAQVFPVVQPAFDPAFERARARQRKEKAA